MFEARGGCEQCPEHILLVVALELQLRGTEENKPAVVELTTPCARKRSLRRSLTSGLKGPSNAARVPSTCSDRTGRRAGCGCQEGRMSFFPQLCGAGCELEVGGARGVGVAKRPGAQTRALGANSERGARVGKYQSSDRVGGDPRPIAIVARD
jgi:hypothetical protein